MPEAGTTGRGLPADASASAELKVFISYSRKDVDFADDLELFLDTRGFEPIVDRHDIDPNEDWRPRLGELIHACDVVVFVLTETSAGSPVCAWEVEEAMRLGKRRLVVTPGPVPAGVAPPPGLGAANWIHCWRNPDVPTASLANGKKELERALRADVAWLRERTRLMEQAAVWRARGAAADSPHLLRGDVLADALAWARRTPKDESVPDGVTAFLAASEAHEAKLKAEAEAGFAEKQAALDKAAKAGRRVRLVGLIGSAVAVVLLAAAGVAGWWGLRNLAEAQRQSAEVVRRNSDILAREAEAMGADGLTELAMLMALQADPAGLRTADGAHAGEGFPIARAILAAQSGRSRLLKTFEGDNATFSPDGKRIVTTHYDGNVAVVRDIESGKELARLSGHSESIKSAVFSPDGQRVLTGSYDGTARVWDAASGKPMMTIIVPDGRNYEGLEYDPSIDGSIVAAAFSPDGKRIVTTSLDHVARVWDVGAGNLLLTLSGHDGTVRSAAFSQDGSRIVTASDDSTARIWDAIRGKTILVLATQNRGLLHAAFSRDGYRIATASRYGELRLWSTEDGRTLATLAGHTDDMEHVSFAPDDTSRLISISTDGTARVWRHDQTEFVISGLGGYPGHATFSPDGKAVMTSSAGVTQIWAATADDSSLYSDYIKLGPRASVFSPDGKLIATPYEDGTVGIWNAASRRDPLNLAGHTGNATSAAFSPNSKHVVSGSDDATARIWDAASGKAVKTFAGHAGGVIAVAFSPDGNRLVTGSHDKTARVWDVGDGKTKTTLTGHGGRVDAVAFSPDGKRVVTGGEDKTARIWDAETGQILMTLTGQTFAISQIGFSTDGARVFVVSRTGEVRVWDATSGKEIGAFTRRQESVWISAVSSDGRRVVTAPYEQSIKVWDIASNKVVMDIADLSADVGRMREEVFSIAFSPDGRRVVFTSSTGYLSAWDLPEVVPADARKQVEIACNKLWRAGAKLAFTAEDVRRWPVLQGEAADAEGNLLSPCRGVLPYEAFPVAVKKAA